MVTYHALHPATFKLDGGAMFGIIPKPLWEKKIPADELNRIHLSLRVLCIQTDQRVILIDTGIGDYHDPKFAQRFAIVGEAHPLLGVLQSLGLRAEDVTDLVVSHLHFDHVGGLGQGAKPQFFFPNARLHIHRKHFEYSKNPTQRDMGSFQTEYFLPIIEALEEKKQIEWHDGNEGLLLQDGNYSLKFRVSHGHTPWLMHPYDDRMIYMADLVPTSAHVPIPWVMGYDIAPGRTTQDKEEFYHFIQKNRLTMIFEHDMKFWGAQVEMSGHEAKIQKAFSAETTATQRLDF